VSALQTLSAAGLTLRAEGDRIVVTPALRLTPELRRLAIERKAELLESFLIIAARLDESVNRCCDERGDDAKNRADLLFECSQLSPQGQADLCEHFERQAAIWANANAGIAP
jgi:hypothetical protein